MPNQKYEEFTLYYLKKTEGNKACFKHVNNHIGKIYIPIPLVKKMGITDEIIVQLAASKKDLPTGAYVTRAVYEKTTTNTIRFTEDVKEKCALGQIYVRKDVLKIMGLQDEIAVRVVTPTGDGKGDVAVER